MAVSLLSYEVSDLCIGKPRVRSLQVSATVGEALLALRACGETYLSVWSCERSPEKKTCLGKVCIVDVICYLCAEENLSSPSSALKSPVSVLLSKDSGLVRRVEWHTSVTESLDQILDGAQNLVVPINGTTRKKIHPSVLDFCWLTQEDFVRFFLNSIGHFSSIAALSVENLGIIQSEVIAVRCHDPALTAVPLIKQALNSETAVAVITDDGKLIGEISQSAIANCDETVAAAIATLSAGALMAYIDCGGQREDIGSAVRARLVEKKMEGMLELLEEEFSTPSLISSSSDEESSDTSPPRRRRAVGYRRSESYSARMSRRSEEGIVCHPGSSLLAVMIQALAHRVSYVWVVEEGYELAGIVKFSDVLKVFREHLQAGI